MIIKKYVVNDMNEALNKIKSELGKDAVIISSRKIKKGGVFGLFSKKFIEVTAGAYETKKYDNYGGHNYHYYDDNDYGDYPGYSSPIVAKPVKSGWGSGPKTDIVDYSQPNDTRYFPKIAGRNIVVPSGDCPVKPKGYKDGWPDGKASPEVVQEWAVAVYNSASGYAPEAILYFARFFWDIHDEPEFARIRNLIIDVISKQN